MEETVQKSHSSYRPNKQTQDRTIQEKTIQEHRKCRDLKQNGDRATTTKNTQHWKKM